MMEMQNSSRRQLMKKIQETDFYALDLQLYLNTHPNCERALLLYQNTVKKAKMLRDEYEEKYGPVTAFGAAGKAPWTWIESPWTWEKERS